MARNEKLIENNYKYLRNSSTLYKNKSDLLKILITEINVDIDINIKEIESYEGYIKITFTESAYIRNYILLYANGDITYSDNDDIEIASKFVDFLWNFDIEGTIENFFDNINKYKENVENV